MIFGYGSDFHMEELPGYRSGKYKSLYRRNPELYDQIIEPPKVPEGTDVLLLSGDICELRHVALWEEFIKKVSRLAPLVIIGDGNHHFWGKSYQKGRAIAEHLNSLCDNVHIINNDSIEINGVSIFVSGLWTDFGGDQYLMWSAAHRDRPGVTDKNLVKIKWEKCGYYRKIKPNNILDLSIEARKSIEKWLIEAKSKGLKPVLMTHYPPFGDKVLPGENNVEALDYTDLSETLSHYPEVTIVHGHLHNVSDYTSKTGHACYCNPRGNFDEASFESYQIKTFSL